MKTVKSITAIALVGTILLMTSSVYAEGQKKGRAHHSEPVVYVISQDLYYDTIILGDLQYNGTDNFQLLEFDGPTGVQTDFGPTDTGYYGGRWWVDISEPFGEMDEGDMYFLCPLLGPGRTEP